MNKNNHEQISLFIRQAIAACSYDSALSETKSYLVAALNKVDIVSKKHSRKLSNEAFNKKAEENRTKQQEWWDMIKKNASKNIDLGIETD